MPQPPTDREAITELMGAYALLIDRHDVDRWLDLFDEPAVIESDGRPPLVTPEQRRAMAEAVPAGVHVANMPIITIADGARRATAQQVFLFVNVVSGASLGGWYDDDLVKREGTWRFARRSVHYFA